MRDALNATGRPIYYAMCNWGQAESWEWAGALANSWRTTGDIGDLFTGWSFNCPCTDKQCWMVDWLDFGINTCSVTNILDKHAEITRVTSILLSRQVIFMANASRTVCSTHLLGASMTLIC